jgi:hypothetical protein
MANESIIAVPVDVAEPKVLKRFLTRLIEELDLVLGFRGGDPYVSQSDLVGASTSLLDLAKLVKALTDTLSELNTEVSELAEAVQDNADYISSFDKTLSTVSLSAVYNDFDATNYQALQGRAEFSALGSALTNAPFATVPATTYYCFFNCATTVNGGVVQELVVYDVPSALGVVSYTRVGNTFADALANGFV